MFPEDNVPSEREWAGTPINMEPYHPKPIEWSTGAWNGPLIELDPNDPFGDMERIFSRGIHVTAIAPPDQGWPVAYYCPLCKETVFLLSPYACKPTVDGKEYDGYHVIKDICAHETLGFKHNMKLAMKGYYAPIELKPSSLWWAKEEKP